MRSKSLLVYSLCLCILILSGCKDDTYEYPSVKLEFITVESGADGRLQTFVTDEGKRVTIVEDKTETKLEPGDRMRVVSNYEIPVSGAQQGQGIIYALGSVISSEPIPMEELEEEVEMKTDPVRLQSIWMGEDYLNFVFWIKSQSGAHYFRFIEDKVITDAGGNSEVFIMLYHDAGNDVEAYSKKGYGSIPLRRYAELAAQGQVSIHLRLKTYDNADDELECHSFDYTPSSLYE